MTIFIPFKRGGNKSKEASGPAEGTVSGASHENERVKEKLPGKMWNISLAQHNGRSLSVLPCPHPKSDWMQQFACLRHERIYLNTHPNGCVCFQLQGEIEVLQSTRARHDWIGGSKLDLSVRQGEILEILRVTNNPEGKWLARNLNGNCEFLTYLVCL